MGEYGILSNPFAKVRGLRGITDAGDYPGHWAAESLGLLGLSAPNLLDRNGSLVILTWTKRSAATTPAAG